MPGHRHLFGPPFFCPTKRSTLVAIVNVATMYYSFGATAWPWADLVVAGYCSVRRCAAPHSLTKYAGRVCECRQ
jgi:hypothetical protein